MRIRAAITTALLITCLAACNPQDTPVDEKGASQSSTPPELTPEQRASINAAAGIPEDPDDAHRQAYLDGLLAVDPDIVHGKDDKAISRGKNQCQTIHSFPKDKAKQIDQAMQRFTSPTHPEGRTRAVAEKINDLAHKQLCPAF
ncbi:hypothetical protein [Streptomyces liangshanensis]|uniref:hypothetical protein n=1 Tax=Streptomyces liangshanensis TaxID=2717324 RepID=UPI0036DE69D8